MTIELERVAYHEAGHAVLVFVLDDSDFDISDIDLDAGDISYYIDASEFGELDILNAIALICAGFTAEDIRFGPSQPVEEEPIVWEEVTYGIHDPSDQPKAIDDVGDLEALVSAFWDVFENEALNSVEAWHTLLQPKIGKQVPELNRDIELDWEPADPIQTITHAMRNTTRSILLRYWPSVQALADELMIRRRLRKREVLQKILAARQQSTA